MSGVTTGRHRLTSSVLVKVASSACNMKCTYCFYREKKIVGQDGPLHRMNEAVLEALIQQVMGHTEGPVNIAWQGGEPTLIGLEQFEKIVSLQKKYGYPGQIVSNAIQTNGLLLNMDWIHFFSRYNFLVGLSLDGPARHHDTYRLTKDGQPTFSRVYPKIRMLQQGNIAFNLLVVLNRRTVRHPEELYNFLIDNGIRYVQFIPAVEQEKSGRLARFSMEEERYGRFLCTLFDLWFNGGHPRISVRMFDSLLGFLLTGEQGLCFFKRDCGDHLVVEVDGSVYTCDFFVNKRWRLGNILEQPLWQLEKSHVRESFSRRKANLPEQCQCCKWRKFCYGGCPKYRVFTSPNHMCNGYKQFFEYAVPILQRSLPQGNRTTSQY